MLAPFNISKFASLELCCADLATKTLSEAASAFSLWADMIVSPKIRGFICTTAHPTGCAKHVADQIAVVKKRGPIANGPKKVLVIGSSTGYGLSSRIAAAFGNLGSVFIFFHFYVSSPTKSRLRLGFLNGAQASRFPSRRSAMASWLLAGGTPALLQVASGGCFKMSGARVHLTAGAAPGRCYNAGLSPRSGSQL